MELDYGNPLDTWKEVATCSEFGGAPNFFQPFQQNWKRSLYKCRVVMLKFYCYWTPRELKDSEHLLALTCGPMMRIV